MTRRINYTAWVNKVMSNLVLDPQGKVMVKHSIAKAGWKTNDVTLREFLREEFKRRGLEISRRQVRTNSNIPDWHPSQAKKSWDELNEPAVFEIVNKTTGRRWIGVSTAPAFHRSRYFYYMRNLDLQHKANVFRLCEQMKIDIQKYGIQDFYINIVKKLPPEYDRIQMDKAKIEYMKTVDPMMLYNKGGQLARRGKDIVSPIRSPISQRHAMRRELLAQIRATREQLKSLVAQYESLAARKSK